MIVLIWGLRQYPSGCGTLARRANEPRHHCEPPGRAGAGVIINEGAVSSPSPTKAVLILPLPVLNGARELHHRPRGNGGEDAAMERYIRNLTP